MTLQERPVEDLFDDFDERLRERRAGSFLRFNDGEAMVSGCPDHYPATLLCRQLRTHFGNNVITDADYLSLRAEMNAAFRAADWIGIPPPDWPPLFSRARDVLERAVLDGPDPSPGLTHVSFPQVMHERGLFEPMLRDRDFLGLVGCRDLRRYFADNYGVKATTFVNVPEQGGAAYSGTLPPHWPRFARAVVAGIRVPYPGALFLIGAGFCGKIYADAIRRRGGLALDVGSLMDLWAGRFTRPYMDFETIVSYYERLLEAGDTAPATFHAVADYHKLKGDVDQESAAIDQAIAENAYLFDFHFRKVGLLLRLGRQDEAATHALDAMSRRRFGGSEVFTLAKLFLNVQDRNHGSQFLSLAFELDPTYEPTLVELANFYMDRGYTPPPDMAFSFFETMEVAADISSNSILLGQFARMLGARGRYGEAIEASNRATGLFSYDSHVFNQRAGWEDVLALKTLAGASRARAAELEHASLTS